MSNCVQHLIVLMLVVVLATPVYSQFDSARMPSETSGSRCAPLNLSWPEVSHTFAPQRVSPSMHPAAKGALVGAAVGAGAMAGLGLWYCTIGPNEVGECGIEQWVPGLALWAAVGAGVGALIGALR